ncbi:tRNA (adenosine(37)-N6)-dimethylallyltransferase MiaA [Schnuerera sp. xch1]|nr:tRNA (adenosine(37)-N6)-dimethylallyltransferase MiaA [Schnuerera sp. xch1]MBZ2173801.1 tRNA (adenosine(37)-N6)-dimethylallyltransferase MiaA [Schnuerera sp. xch1]
MGNKKNLLVIVGPTATGKTSISIDVAKKINGEIVSADSMQIYKFMDIGTAKVSLSEMDDVPHYLIDIVYPDEDFSVADYKHYAEEYINKIDKSGHIPIVVGGTGLYINSLVYELKFTKVESNENFRKKYNRIANIHGNQYLYDKLYKIDPISCKKININDKKRIIRALEIYHETGKPMSSFNKNFRKETDKYNLVMFGLTTDRSILYSRINKRVDSMIEGGLIKEVQKLMDMGYHKDLKSMKAIGYKEIISYLEGEVELAEAIRLLKRNTRRYAKRQLTWFRRDDRIKWIDTSKFSYTGEIVDHITDYCKDMFKLNI